MDDTSVRYILDSFLVVKMPKIANRAEFDPSKEISRTYFGCHGVMRGQDRNCRRRWCVVLNNQLFYNKYWPSGYVGFVIGGFLSLMSSSFAYEDPLLRQQTSTAQKAKDIFKEMGKGVWKSGKGFGKVGALFAGIECVFESVRRYPLQ